MISRHDGDRLRVRWLLARALLGLAWCVPLVYGQPASGPAGQTTVILVRHADRASEPMADPPLTAAGVSRANDLAAVLRDAGIRWIITTQFLRTKATAAPLARLIGVVPEEIPELDAPRPDPICESVFDQLFVVTVPNDGPSSLLQLHYGARSPRDTACAVNRPSGTPPPFRRTKQMLVF